MNPIDRKEAGDAGESAALQYLQDAGLRLILKNYRCRGGEIDLVMLDRQTLALIEVRLRSDQRFGGAAASVTSRKQQRLMIAAKHLLLTKPELGRHRARFDVIALTPQANEKIKIDWIRDAFRIG